MNHQQAEANLDALLDGALGALDRWAVIVHLSECDACLRHVAAEGRLRTRVRHQIEQAAPEPGFSQRLQDVLSEEIPAPRSPRSLPTLRQVPLRLALVLGPSLAAIWLLVQVSLLPPAVATDVTPELTASHAIFAQDDSLLDVVGDAGAVSSWFRDHAGIAVTAPPLADFTLLGGRLIVLHDKQVAQLVYLSEPDRRYLSLLTYPDAEAEREPPTLEQRDGIAIATWPLPGKRAALLGEVSTAELRPLVESLAGWDGAEDTPGGRPPQTDSRWD
jgi:anti-sigma factor RsiW